MPFVVGESIGPYAITRQLGVRGLATVWKANHPTLDVEPERVKLHPGMGDAYLVQGERALRTEPQVPEGHSGMGLYFVKHGDTERARSEFEIAVETAPGFLAERARRQLDRLD